MKPITKEMLQKAGSAELIAKNREDQLRKEAMPLVTKVYDFIKNSMHRLSDQTMSKKYLVSPRYANATIQLAAEILKEYFPGCTISTKDVLFNDDSTIPRKQIVINWS